MDTKELQDKLFLTLDPKSGYTMEDFERDLKSLNFNKINYKINIKILNKSNNPLPEFSTEEASGFDIRAFIPKEHDKIVLLSGTVQMIPTGLYFDIPNQYELQIRPRSGLASKGIICNFGTVDSDYTGEVKAILFNLTNQDFIINNGDRVAQGVFASKLAKQIINFEQVNKIEKITERAESGFGSTGLK